VSPRPISWNRTTSKLISTIINHRISSKINYHQSVHGFRKRRGTSIAIIEAKLRMPMAARRTMKPLYFVFMDLKKAYDTLDRQRTIQILKGYGVRPNFIRFIEKNWKMDTIVFKQAGFSG
jgi:Reverse transcriptase (RNA-dependent DNA polymerase)